MPDLSPIPDADLSEALAVALLRDGRKRVDHADALMARITAVWLVQRLAADGFVILRKPPGAPPTTSRMPVPGGLAPTR